MILFIITAVNATAQAQCLSPLNSKSDMSPNPEDINGNFEFDYKITSSIEVKAKYDNGGTVSYKTKRYVADYFVNSADGSAYFPKGFFMTNFGRVSSRQGTILGSVWMANGQMVNYVLDDKGVPRTVTVSTSQTSGDVVAGQNMFTGSFLNGIRDATSIPAEIPVDLPWGDTGGFVSEIAQEDGSVGVVTMYFAVNPDIPPIKTNRPLTGFLVGVFKDDHFSQL